ncbi:MAG: hypothetical protein IJJ86_07510 [Clostridia bacterium]|nr:hypothetical protein [Clostridia bacterium]
MEQKVKTWRIVSTVLAIIGAALLVTMLVLRLLGKEVMFLAYPIVGVMILFLIADELCRSAKRRIEKEAAEREKAEHPEENAPEPTLPQEAFEFEPSEPDDRKQ